MVAYYVRVSGAAALCLLLGACVRAAPPAALDDLRGCPGPVQAPLTPRASRDAEAPGWWAAQVAALVQTEAARAECARRLDRVFEWIDTGGLRR